MAIKFDQNILIKVALLSIFFAVGCGPTFQTDYLYEPPKSQLGQNCIFQCSNSKNQCLQLEDFRKNDCENRAQLEYDRCEDRIRYKEGRDPKWYECSKESCSSNEERCDESYRTCYTSCGGKVDVHTYCVSGCDQLPPGGAQQAR